MSCVFLSTWGQLFENKVVVNERLNKISNGNITNTLSFFVA